MALYKYSSNLSVNQHGNFDTLRDPGTEAPDAGIYRCEVCGREIPYGPSLNVLNGCRYEH